MIIDTLRVTDFRVFQGSHAFDFAPRERWGAKRPVILFGGLNGAGKTSILTAVRLGLYGKLSLGRAVSRKGYEDFLRKSIHKSKDNLLQANHAAVELNFRYSHMGVSNQYLVKRSWSTKGSAVNESIEISRDGSLLDSLTYEQKQGFLNELIPIGVSDLFFFDGEKIAELATDKSGSALSDSIKRLLGLDVVDRLSSDLGVIVREHNRVVAEKDIAAQMSKLEEDLKRADGLARESENEFEQVSTHLEHQKKAYDLEEADFLANGGAWANSRSIEIQRQKELEATREELQNDIRSLLAGKYPISLAQHHLEMALSQVRKEESVIDGADLKLHIERVIDAVDSRLFEVLSSGQYSKVRKELDEINATDFLDSGATRTLHGVGARVLGSLEAASIESKNDKERMKVLASRLSEVSEELDKVGLRIARAPDEKTVEIKVKVLDELRSERDRLSARKESLREEAKRHLREVSELARKLEKLHDEVESSDRTSENVSLARSAQTILSEFAHRASEEKTLALEQEFSRSFRRLARKDDMLISAKINPKSFKVVLRNDDGSELDKNELSAGEQQIYAISMLEALAKTSGRKLPIIIDTPLGRLDSKHRDKLVNDYFPTASHQVIILSTDTEVDERFYSDLYKHMSHAYRLEYCPDSGATKPEEGYFWKSNSSFEAA